ncbi:Trehalase [Toxocara canis]|uniref:Trehalase n=1 Tax=Toxocara canis TaxID=6265 RepID=A0A0B2VSU7_TOXCA|nr:Trehalase [Toxocara canis]
MPAWPVVVALAALPFAPWAIHVGVSSPDAKRSASREKSHVDVLHEPVLPNCTEPICIGPLASIYCSGGLIHASWMFGLQDTCPGDMMLQTPDAVIAAFNKLKYPLKRDDFKRFCTDNFMNFPYLKAAKLSDWMEEPPNLRSIKDDRLRKLAKKLNDIWKFLGREFDEKVKENPDLFPVLTVPNSFVVPGGLFQMYFYWDSYWIIKGLIFSNMTLTARHMIENFASVIQYHGFIPNSGNVQLSRRSQPPLFVQMLADYYYLTRNKTFLSSILPLVDIELSWWLRNRSVILSSNFGEYTMFHFHAASNCPRPENYLVDLRNGLEGTGGAKFIWSSIASACESGLDFSSRWFAYTGPHARTKFSIRTNSIIPVDLNTFMVWNYDTTADLYLELGLERKSENYRKLAADLWKSIETVLWNESEGVWLDYDLSKQEHRRKFYPSNVFPLLTGRSTLHIADRILYYLRSSGALDFRGGIPSTLDDSSHEQWDFPNGWAPSIHLFVESLRRSSHPSLFDVAVQTADKFIRTVYNGLFNPVGEWPPACWEKYDIRYDDGRPGVSGEYPVQQGFGWTNGAVLDMILRFHVDKDEPFLLPSEGFVLTFGHSPHAPVIALAFIICITFSAWFAYQALGNRHVKLKKGVWLATGLAEESRLIDEFEEDS